MGSDDQKELKLEATELRLGLPGMQQEECEKQNAAGFMMRSKKRALISLDYPKEQQLEAHALAVVGWPPVRSRSQRKKGSQNKSREEEEGTAYVKVSMDGAPYLRKIDLNLYKGYTQVLMELEHMFNFKLGVYCEKEGYNGSDYVPTYQDKDGDWMLVGDVPWEMFSRCCKRLRIIESSEAKGLCCGD